MRSTITSRFSPTWIIATLAWIWFACTVNADTATNKTLFDFQAATNSPAWEVENDDVMGGVSTSQFQVLTNGCAVFVGFLISDKQAGPFRLEIGWIKASPARR